MERVLFAPRDLPPLRPDAASDPARYDAWFLARERDRLETTSDEPDSASRVSVDVLIALEHPSSANAVACLESLATQRRSVPGGPPVKVIVTVALSADAVAELSENQDPRAGIARGVHRIEVPRGASVPAALAVAFAATDAPFVVFVDPDDLLSPDAIALLVAALTPRSGPEEPLVACDVAYADDDCIDGHGRHALPRFKPDWSPDLLLATNYLGRPVAYRRSLLVRAGRIGEVSGGDWEHDMALRCTEVASGVAHIPEVLGHRQWQNGGHTHRPEGGGAAVLAALQRRGEDATVEEGPLVGTWHVVRRIRTPHRISIIIPFRDAPRLLRTCVDSIFATAGDVDFEVVLVDNGSVEPETFSLLDRLDARPGVTTIRDDQPFNWPALNNAAVRHADGDVILFLNNDIEARTPGWLDLLLGHAIRADIGAVGARLLYPTGRVQHIGVVIGMGGAAGHVLGGLAGTDPGYLGMAQLTRECAAVTGACLATRRDLFDGAGGFDEVLGVDLNDVDYCLRLAGEGYRTVMEAGSVLIHHESPSRGTSGSVADIVHFVDRWEALISAGDGLLSPNLTRVDSSCALRGSNEEGWWSDWRSSLAGS